jgi:hypothetical protein
MVRASLSIAVALTLALAGCSDDEALSAEDFTKEANEICAEGSKRIDKLNEDLEARFGDEEPTDDELREAFGELLDEIADQIDEIRELEGPNELEADVNDVLDDSEEAIAGLRADIEDDPTSVLTGEDPFAEVNERLTELDLDECGE